MSRSLPATAVGTFLAHNARISVLPRTSCARPAGVSPSQAREKGNTHQQSVMEGNLPGDAFTSSQGDTEDSDGDLWDVQDSRRTSSG